jgi:hypothetical protein
MASQHLWTARREAWLCRKREDQLLNDANLDRRHRSHAITAVLSAVAFLEAFINAVWQDAADSEPSKHYTSGIPDDALATMRELWNGKDQAERMLSLLSTFQVALVCAGHERINPGAEPFQSVDVLVDLRDFLVHYKPQWHWPTSTPSSSAGSKTRSRSSVKTDSRSGIHGFRTKPSGLAARTGHARPASPSREHGIRAWD